LRAEIALAIPTPDYLGAVISLFDLWRLQAPHISAPAVGAALVTASFMEKKRREVGVEVVWTGPDQSAIPTRQTEQAILEVPYSAQSRILLVSYAVPREHLRADATGRIGTSNAWLGMANISSCRVRT
jgi:hypothetical protein